MSMIPSAPASPDQSTVALAKADGRRMLCFDA